jgi:hypothetical protein
MQPITTEEAVLCLEYLDHDFYVYNNKETKKISGASAVTCAQRSRERMCVCVCVCVCVCGDFARSRQSGCSPVVLVAHLRGRRARG